MRFLINIMVALTGVLITLFVFASCLSAPENENRQDQTEKEEKNKIEKKEEEKKGEEDKQELVLGMSQITVDFDPLHAFTSNEFQLYSALYEGLVSYHPLTLEPLPGMAKSWDISEDGKTCTFYIRDEAYYSNGDQVKAGDFRNAWLRIINPDNKAEYSVFFDIIKGVQEYRQDRDEDKIGIKVLSDKVLEVTLVKPADHFLKILCHMSFVPIHPSYIGKTGWGKNTNLITNGPYHMLNWTKEELLLSRNNLYWDADNVAIERVKIIFNKDAKYISEKFNNEQIQWATEFDAETIKNKSAFVAHPMFSTNYFFFSCAEKPWSDFHVRRGLALLLPWSEIRKADYLFPTNTLVPSFPDYPKIEGITEQKKEEALYHLKEAGFENGKNLPQILIKVPEGGDELEMAQVMAKTWKEELEADVKIKAYPYGSYFDQLKEGDFTIGIMTWIGDFIDPLTFLQMWQTNSNLNDSKFSDPEYDNFIDESYSEKGTARYEKLAKAEEILLNKAVVLPVRNYIAFNAVNTHMIEGWYPNLLDMHPFKYIRFKEERVFPNVVRLSE